MKKVKKLIGENRKLEIIINSTSEGLIFVNQQQEIELFNKAAERIMKLKKEDVLGKKVREVIPNTRMHIVLETGEEELNQVQDVGETVIVANRYPVTDNEGNIAGTVAVFKDITEARKLAEEVTDLKEIRVMLEAIINTTQDAISVVDVTGKGIMINKAYTRLTGLCEEDVIGKPATVDIAEGENMHYKVLKTRKAVQGVRMKVGPLKKEVLVNAAPIIVDDRLRGSVGVIHDVSEIKRLTEELNHVKKMMRQLNARYTFDDIIGISDTIKAAKNQARKASKTPVTVLLRGESGTGKELFAHAIHNASPRKSMKFIRVNCSSLTDSLLESELFGYEEGAFTGAKKGGKKGLFEEADDGTIFLDEIGNISLNLQSKLLRVLQEKEITRVGGTRPVSVDVRIIVATNTNLEKAIQEGKFREDLYYRLNVFPIYIPPLRERKEDIPYLVQHIIHVFNQEYGSSVRGCTDRLLERLSDYEWPGNVRELENIIGRAMINLGNRKEIIESKHLPSLGPISSRPDISPTMNEIDFDKCSLKDIIGETEKRVMLKALKRTDGNRTEAAKLLGIAIRSFYYKMEKYGIE